MAIQEIQRKGGLGAQLGAALGKGLAEQIPKEVDRYRLAKGLEEIGQQKGLTPFQQYSQMAAVPGITPQVLQGASELLKYQSFRDALANRSARSGQSDESGNMRIPERQPLPEFGKQGLNGQQIQEKAAPGEMPSQGQPVDEIIDTNPLRPSALPKGPWSPEKKQAEMSNLAKDYPFMTFSELESMASDIEKRQLAGAEAEQRLDQYLNDISDKADEELNKSLLLKIQKTPDTLKENIPGTIQNLLRKGMRAELKQNPQANIKELADKWSEKGLELDKVSNDMEALASRNFAQPSETRNKLETWSKIYKGARASEEYASKLTSEFGLSPSVSAKYAFPVSKQAMQSIEKNVKQTNPKELLKDVFGGRSQKIAADIIKNMTPEDSLLSIAREAKTRDPLFNEHLFFKYIRDNMETIPLNDRQKRELGKGETPLFPTWADIWIEHNPF